MMNNRTFLLSAAALSLFVLSGCALGGGNSSGQSSGRVAPLVVPPDFALTPAQASAVRSQDAGQEQMLDALFGGLSARSATERALAVSAGTADAGIRSSVGDPLTITVNKGSVTRDIIAAPEGDGQSAQAVIPG